MSIRVKNWLVPKQPLQFLSPNAERKKGASLLAQYFQSATATRMMRCLNGLLIPFKYSVKHRVESIDERQFGRFRFHDSFGIVAHDLVFRRRPPGSDSLQRSRLHTDRPYFSRQKSIKQSHKSTHVK